MHKVFVLFCVFLLWNIKRFRPSCRIAAQKASKLPVPRFQRWQNRPKLISSTYEHIHTHADSTIEIYMHIYDVCRCRKFVYINLRTIQYSVYTCYWIHKIWNAAAAAKKRTQCKNGIEMYVCVNLYNIYTFI